MSVIYIYINVYIYIYIPKYVCICTYYNIMFTQIYLQIYIYIEIVVCIKYTISSKSDNDPNIERVDHRDIASGISYHLWSLDVSGP